VILIAGHVEALTSTLPRFAHGWPDQVVICIVTIHKGDAFPQRNLLVDLEHVLQVVVVYVKAYRAFWTSSTKLLPEAISVTFTSFVLNKFIAYSLLLAGISHSFLHLQTQSGH